MFRFLMFCLASLCAFLAGCTLSEQQPDNNSVPIVSESEDGKNEIEWFEVNDLYGLRDNNGTEILNPTYNDARPFHDGLAAVNVGAKRMFPGILDGGKWGYVNNSGKLVIPIQYDFAFDFSEGLANVSDLGSTGITFIDRQGNIQIRIPKGTAGDFREGVAPVYLDRSLDGQDWETEYIDTNGKTKFSVEGYGEEFYDGLAVLIVRNGKAVSNENSSYGFVNRTGKTVIEPRFGEALHFSDGLAAVRTEKTTVYGMGDSWAILAPMEAM